MSPGSRNIIKRKIFLGFAALALCLGCSDGGASSGGAGGEAGSPDAGASDGGVSGSAGASGTSGGAGKDNGCELQECFAANTCLDRCGGSVVYVGCCPCVAPAIDRNRCAPNE